MFTQILEKSNLLGAGIILTLAWFVTLCITLVSFFVVTDGFNQIANEAIWNNPDSAIFQIFAVSLILSVLFYISGTTVITIFMTVSSPVKNKLHFIAQYLWIAFGFPFYTLRKLIHHTKKAKKRERILPIVASAFVFLLFVPIWLATYLSVLAGVGYLASDAVGRAPVFENIAGTGSMHPTFPKGTGKTDKENAAQTVATVTFNRYPGGIKLFGKRYFGHTFERGDIIAFENSKTYEITKEDGEATGFIKRIVALPGDTIELRGGIVYLNGKQLKEPYTAKPRSTFAQAFLSECKKITVPADKLFVMGDNRKGSGDSREIGYVDFKDVTSVLPLNAQKNEWDKHWRNTAKDFDKASIDKVNKEEYLALLNEKRKKAGVPQLTYNKELEQSAQKRGEIMLKFNDFGFEASRSGYTMESSMSDVGYFNALYGESPTQGYFTADEMLENQFAFPDSQKFLLEKDYDEVGIAEVEGEIDGCPTQVIVQHYAGYVPPNYSQSDIASWQEALTNLQSIQPSWADLKNNTEFYDQHRGDVDRINSLISTRISIVSSVLSKMQANQWLSAADQNQADRDEALANEIDALATKLNSL
jgi:signal peptidase I